MEKNNLGHERIFTYTLVIWAKNAKKNTFFRLMFFVKKSIYAPEKSVIELLGHTLRGGLLNKIWYLDVH